MHSKLTLLCALAPLTTLSFAAQASILPNGDLEAGGNFFYSSGDFFGTGPLAGATELADLPGYRFEIDNGFFGLASDNPAMGTNGPTFLYIGGGDGTDPSNDVGPIRTAVSSRASASPGTPYELTFDARDENGSGGLFAAIEFFDAGGNLIGDGGSTIMLSSTALDGTPTSFSANGVAPSGTASVGISFSNNGTGVSNFDNFSLTVVPEPGSLALAGLAGLGLLARRRNA